MSATAFKNAVRRREHYERSQPAARAKYGLLEKHKDYVVRARNFHDKEKKIAQLRKKAQNRNPDEFYFKMVKSKTTKGVHSIEQANAVLKGDELRLFKSQDKGYVHMQRSAEDKKIERLQASLHMLADQPMNKHTVFVDSEAALAAFEPADYFNTDSDLVGRAFNRPHRETLEASAALAGASRDARSMRSVKRERDRSYAELDARIDRADKMARLEDTIDRDRELLKKGRRLKVAEAQGGQPATFKWKTQRKK